MEILIPIQNYPKQNEFKRVQVCGKQKKSFNNIL